MHIRATKRASRCRTSSDEVRAARMTARRRYMHTVQHRVKELRTSFTHRPAPKLRRPCSLHDRSSRQRDVQIGMWKKTDVEVSKTGPSRPQRRRKLGASCARFLRGATRGRGHVRHAARQLQKLLRVRQAVHEARRDAG